MWVIKNKNKQVKKKLKTLDLHGFKSDEVFDAVDAFIMKNQNQNRISIMTGKGSGIVKKIVLDYLKKSGYPWEYETSMNGKKNEGVLVIFMD